MNREHLTPDRIRRLTPRAGVDQSYFWDTDAQRLAVRVTVGGSKSFIFESKLNGKTIRLTIGDALAWSLADARAEARRMQTLIDQSIDPRHARRDQIAAAAAKREEAQRFAAPALEAWQIYLAGARPDGVRAALLDHQTCRRWRDAKTEAADRATMAIRRKPASCCRCWRYLWNRSTPTTCAPG
jgi:hypothetical protein